MLVRSMGEISNQPAMCIVPCYREHAHDIEATVASCIGQSSPFARVVVVDDGSPQPVVLPPALSGGQTPVSVLRFEQNRGISASRNQAIRQDDCPLVACVNCQVLLPPQWLSVLAEYLNQHPRVGIVYAQTLSSRPRSLLARWRMKFHEPKPISVSGPAPFAVGHAVLFRREAFDAIGGYNESLKRIGEDGDLCRRMRDVGWDTHFVAGPQCVSTQVDTLRSLAKKQLIRDGWWPGEAYDRRALLGREFRELMSRMARNAARLRLSLLLVDVAIWGVASSIALSQRPGAAK